MIRSMLIVLVPIMALIWLLTDDLRDYPYESVEWRPTLQTVRDAVDWPVQAPQGLPEGDNGWVPTRVSFIPVGDPVLDGSGSLRNHWRVGFLSPGEIYYEINQADDALQQFVQDVTRDGRQVGEEPVGDQMWERWESADGRTRTLVLREGPTVTMVTADVEFVDLQQFAHTLQAS